MSGKIATSEATQRTLRYHLTDLYSYIFTLSTVLLLCPFKAYYNKALFSVSSCLLSMKIFNYFDFDYFDIFI